MDFITRNPGLQHIIEEIFMNLDHKNLLKCQEVNLAWESILKNPTFWLDKCVQKGLSNEDKLEWYKWIKTLKNENSYTGNVISNLMILHECLSLSFSDSFCYICKNAFFNKYFLRIHNRKKHGICSPELPPEKVQKIINEMSK